MKLKHYKRLSSQIISATGYLLLNITLLHAAPVILPDNTLEKITAGNASGGVIVGNSSVAIIDESNSLRLADHVQDTAKGLNIVNSTDSAVANGVNVWAGTDINMTSSTMEVFQLNHINQNQQRSASISNYNRSEADRLVHTENSSANSHFIQNKSHHDQTDIHTRNQTTNTNSTSVVDTSIKASLGDPTSVLGQFEFEAHVGQGVAVAGQLNAQYDGGSVELAMGAGGAISANLDVAILDGLLGAGVGVSAEADVSLYAKIELPKMNIDMNGAGCGVVMGSCSASGTEETTVEEFTDLSSLDIHEQTSAGLSQYSHKNTEEYRSPFELGHAEAEYIVVDNSSLEIHRSYSLILTDFTQSNIRAMNVVNAVGSAVTNAVNVSHANKLNSNGELVLTQSNIITHSR